MESLLLLQTEEVEAVRWMGLEDCMDAVEEGTLPNCLYVDELELVKGYLQEKGRGI